MEKALLGHVNPDFPWVTGTFQNRSIAALTTVVPVILYERGDRNLINGELFVASEDGTWCLQIDSGTVPSTTTTVYASISIERFGQGSSMNEAVSPISSTNPSLPRITTPTATHRMSKGDTMRFSIYPIAALSSISGGTESNRRLAFTFARIA